MRAANAGHGIATEARSPLAQGTLLADPALARIAGRHGRTPAQVVLRRHLQSGTIAIPKSVTPGRIRQNIGVFGSTLSQEEMAALAALDRGARTGPDPESLN